MTIIIRAISRLSLFAFSVSRLLLLLLVPLTILQVMLRYFFQENIVALQELQWHFFGFLITLSIPQVMEQNGHIRVEVCAGKISPDVRSVLHAICFFLLLILAGSLAAFGVFDVLNTRSFPSPLPPDAYTGTWFESTSPGYQLLAPCEGFLREWLLVGEGSPDAGGLEARWIIRSALPLGMCLVSLQALSLFLQSLFPTLRTKETTLWL